MPVRALVGVAPHLAAHGEKAVGLAFGEGRAGEDRGRDRLQRQRHAELLAPCPPRRRSRGSPGWCRCGTSCRGRACRPGACSASSPGSAAWACAASRRASSCGEKPTPRKPMPNGEPAASIWLEMRRASRRRPRARSAADRPTARTGRRAPATRCRRASPSGRFSAMMLSPSMIGSQPKRVDQAFHQRAHAARPRVGHGPQRVGVEQELLVLGADAPPLARLASPPRSRRRDRRASARSGLALCPGGWTSGGFVLVGGRAWPEALLAPLVS